MDEQNAETGRADSIDEVALLDIKVFEPEEGAEPPPPQDSDTDVAASM